MGGKRPDQYQIDPGEAGATDYKSRRNDKGIMEQNKQELAQSQVEKQEGLIPHHGKNPALEDLQAKRAAKAEAEQGGVDTPRDADGEA